jgi:hypothetical protein
MPDMRGFFGESRHFAVIASCPLQFLDRAWLHCIHWLRFIARMSLVDISNGADRFRVVHIDFGHFRAIRPRMLPEFKRDRERVEINPFPP